MCPRQCRTKFAPVFSSLGITAAWLWYRASTIKMPTNLMPDGEYLRQEYFTELQIKLTAAARLNKRATLWTAIATIVAAVGEAIGEVS